MQEINGLENLKKMSLPSAVTIGVFDGVHKGHRLVIKKTVETARENNWQSVVITFDPHPLDVLKPKDFPTILTSLPLKIRLLEEMGTDIILVIKFSKELSRIEPEKFLKEFLIDKLNMKALIVGQNFAFGRQKRGDIPALVSLSSKYGFSLEVISKAEDPAGHKISSTHVRNLIREGKLDEASTLLGRPPTFIGKVEPGEGRGGLTGYHTANVKTEDKASIPKNGVYAGRVLLNGSNYPAVINIGTSPTFGIRKKRIETHIIGFSNHLYGKDITISLFKKIRDIEKFKSPAELSLQIKKDINQAISLLNK